MILLWWNNTAGMRKRSVSVSSAQQQRSFHFISVRLSLVRCVRSKEHVCDWWIDWLISLTRWLSLIVGFWIIVSRQTFLRRRNVKSVGSGRVESSEARQTIYMLYICFLSSLIHSFYEFSIFIDVLIIIHPIDPIHCLEALFHWSDDRVFFTNGFGNFVYLFLRSHREKLWAFFTHR